ncbi:MAG: hypothetical protein WB676_17485 [Bryobacteraceae bacterium]
MGKASRKKRGRKPGEVPINAEVRAALDHQFQLFKKKFGRDPGPSDAVFFDPDADTPQPINPDKLEAEITRAMSLAGIEPAKIYAYKKTGLLASSENWELLSEQDRAAWNQALDEYEAKLVASAKN